MPSGKIKKRNGYDEYFTDGGENFADLRREALDSRISPYGRGVFWLWGGHVIWRLA